MELCAATSGSRLNNLVLTSAGNRELDLRALQPASRLSGKVGWPTTAVHLTAKLRYAVLNNFPDGAYLHARPRSPSSYFAKSLARRLGARGRN